MNSVTKKLSFSLVICLALTSLMIPCASADKIYLKNGGVIETTMCWEETGRVYYVKCYDSIEITINIDKKDVKKIIKEDASDQAYQEEKPAWDKKRQEPERVRIEKDLHQSQQSMAKKKFAQDLVASVPGIINAWWSQDVSLWVEIDITTFASNPKLYAQQIADKLSWAASKKFGYVCVHVYYGKQRQLAKSCG